MDAPADRNRFEVPPPATWELTGGQWAEAGDEGRWLVLNEVGEQPHLVSPPLRLSKDVLYSFKLSARIAGSGYFDFALCTAGDGAVPRTVVRSCRRTLFGPGEGSAGFSFLPPEPGEYRLLIANASGGQASPGERVQPLAVTATAQGPVPELGAREVDTFLPHWGPVRRWIHRRCKGSRTFNALVAAVEMRLGREESLSLPMFLALCPTGQCNALCDFCSVTINRTGIIKKQLPWERLSPFLQATKHTLVMCGLEGNGEPTLYKQFDELVALLREGDSEVYMITNGSRLTPEQIPNVSSLNSVTFSLNAATEETHKRVMKLKNWPDIVRNIKAVVRERGASSKPNVFVSFVVYNYNIHEIQRFLEFAEYELQADVIMIRPLSELGTDELGTIEDLRDIVPYESDVRDALDAVAEYLADVPRRALPFASPPRDCDIRFDTSTFHNVRPDPVERVVMPHGFEDRLLAPRRGDWQAEAEGVEARWHLSTVRLFCPREAPAGAVWSSAPTPVNPGAELTFSIRARHSGVPVTLSALDSDGRVLGSLTLDGDSPAEWREHGFTLNTGDALHVHLVLSQAEAGGFVCDVDFGRLRTPGMGIKSEFKLPYPRRWAVDTAGVTARWTGHRLDLSCGRVGRNYLYKSYFAPCMTNRHLELPVDIEVRAGEAVIGFLSQDAQKWVVQYRLPVGRHRRVLEIDSGENRRLQAVIFSFADEPLDMTIDWGDTLEPTPQRGRQSQSQVHGGPRGALGYPLPGPAPLAEAGAWQAGDSPAGLEALAGGGFRLTHPQAPVGPYLCQGRVIPCIARAQVVFSAAITVHQGEVMVGFLDRTGTWISQSGFGPGSHRLSVPFCFNHDEALTPVVFATAAGPLDVEIVFDPRPPLTIDGLTAEVAAEIPPPVAEAPPAASGGEPAPAPAPAPARPAAPRGPGLWRRLETWATTSRRRVYCQKPWTDMNNFTVDGRMDVCCITTGASQARYSLGNINSDDFQQIWNGPSMREFRRTVNTDEKLPPCARCPMNGAYSGIFFDRSHTYTVLQHMIAQKFFGGVGAKSESLMAVLRFLGDALHFKHMRK